MIDWSVKIYVKIFTIVFHGVAEDVDAAARRPFPKSFLGLIFIKFVAGLKATFIIRFAGAVKPNKIIHFN